MSDLSPAALSAVPRQGTVFGKDVTFYPLTIGDILEWDCFAQGQYRRGARMGMNDGTDDEKLQCRKDAAEESKSICFGSKAGRDIEWSFTGYLYIAWLSLRHGNPKLTLDETAKIFGFGTQHLGDQKYALEVAKIQIHIASGLIAEETVLGLEKPKKNESQAMANEAKTSPMPDTGNKSSATSGSITSATLPG